MNLQKPVVTIAIALAFVQVGHASPLSPAEWNPAERKQAEALELSTFPPQQKNFLGHSMLISNTGSPVAVHAGIEVLRHGGTAADAAAAVALTHITMDLGSSISYAGITQVLYYDAKTGKVSCLSAGWNSYRDETDPKTIPTPDLSIIGSDLGKNQPPDIGSEGRQTLVPGFMAGIEALHKRFGRLPFAQLFEPAIWYAENGVTIAKTQDHLFALEGKALERTPEGQAFLHQAGSPLPKEGERFVQAALAKTLRGVARFGAQYMYSGPWAKHYVAAVRRDGGKVTLGDMSGYRAEWQEPASTTFAGYTVLAPGANNEAGHQVLEALNLIEELQLEGKPPYWKDPTEFNQLSRILQFVELGPFISPEVAEYRRKNNVTFTPGERITKAFARAMAPIIEQSTSSPPGNAIPASRHTAAVVVVDRWGNVAALVHTINALPWGATGIVVDGVPISDAAGIQQARLAAIKPGSRVPDDLAPLIILRERKPILATASVGTASMAETVRIVYGMLGQHLDAQTLLAAPPLLYNVQPPAADESLTWKGQFVPEGAYSADFLAKLQSDGVRIIQQSPLQALTNRGTTALVNIEDDGTLHSAEDPKIFDFVEAY